MGLNAYLFFNGNCEEAMNFYKDATGGSIERISRYGEAPMPCSDSEKNLIMHCTLNINGAKLMCSDTAQQREVSFGTNFSMALDYNSDDEMQHAFDALSAGGVVSMPLQDTFWGAKFGMCTDKFGVKWMFNHDKPKNND